ncbi:L,D-transpeptidase family protein, partial [Nocardioides sp.]|uniref:L,D-transpeptidase family protein n=1 Tax=Nocardioides sp. TaxID=35761 RepID=UPI0025ED4AD9
PVVVTPPKPLPVPPLLEPGDEGDEVRDLQARLKQLAWYFPDVDGVYGEATTEAVRGFQEKRGFDATGEVDRRTMKRLRQMSTTPTHAELHNLGNVPGALDARCRTGRAMCVDKTSRTIRWVVDGKVVKTMDVRFGGPSTPTREGLFHVGYKSRDHHSRLYDTDMPFAMFFSGGQAVHYSPDFASVGYNGASHGCVNVRDYDGVAWLFDQVEVGDKVVVYWS